MRRGIEIILLALTLLLFATAFISCRKNEARLQTSSAQRLSEDFHCTVSASLGGTDYETTLSKQGANYTLSFSKPSELSQLSFALTDEGMKVRFGDIEASVDPSSIPQSALVNAVMDVFNAVSSKTGISAKKSGEDVVLSGKTGAGHFTMTLNPDYTPKSLSIPSIGLNAALKGFQFSS